MCALVAGLSVGHVQAEVSIDYSTRIDYRINEEVSIVNGVDSLPDVRFVDGAYLAEGLGIYGGSIAHFDAGHLSLSA
jgi:hypothetical protein